MINPIFKNRYLQIFIFLLFLGSAAQAQPFSATTYETMLEIADESYEKGDYYNAIEWLDKAYKESRDQNLKIEMADLHMLLRNYKKAERSYASVLRRDKDGIYKDFRIDYAKSLKYQNKIKEAVEELRTVAATTANDSIKNLALFELKGIEESENYNTNIDAVIKFVEGDVNSGSGENSPILDDDGKLYYSSFDTRSTITLEGEDAESYHAKIFKIGKNDEGEWEDPEALDEAINREGFNSAGVSFSADGKTMYFTRALLDVNELKQSELFVSYRGDGGWRGANAVESLNGDYLVLHPFEGELYGNKVLFFASDMPGGYGGLDLYYSTINGDQFATPINLGEVINTPKDEVTPFYLDGTLYFSSNGRVGFGGKDIFYTGWTGSNFEAPTNMGFNYNTPQDDLYLRFTEDGTKGFLVSNRPNSKKKKIEGSDTCCDDIYSIEIREIIIDLLATIFDEATGEPLKEATVELVELAAIDGDGIQSKTNISGNDFNFLLDSEREYKVVVTRGGYFPDSSLTFNTYGYLDDIQKKEKISLKPKPVTPDKNTGDSETMEVAINEPIRLNNIYYDFEKWDILPDAEEDLEYLYSLMEQYPDMVIELSSHTDSRGGTKYNQRLSQKRANSAVSWLIERGVTKDRMQAVGYGEEQIINGCTNGVDCTEDQHQQNRRTEFKIIAGPQTITIKRIKTRSGDSPVRQSGKQMLSRDTFPIMSFVEKHKNLGTLVKGEKKNLEYHFVNTGSKDLLIELVTTCKCTDITWPKEAIKPGGKGVIKAIYDSTQQKVGSHTKSLDIIANTNPIVVEAKFDVVVLPEGKKTE